MPAHAQTLHVYGAGEGAYVQEGKINSLIWGFLFVYMINTAPVTREILSVQLKTASLVENSRFGSVSRPLHFAGTEMCWFWSDGDKVHPVSPVGLEGGWGREVSTGPGGCVVTQLKAGR